MLARTAVRTAIAGITLLLQLVAVAPSASAATVAPAQVTITYDASQASEYADAIAQGIAIWNEQLENVQIDEVEPGGDPDVSFVADPGWPRAEIGPAMPGDDLTVWFGKEGVDEGYDLVRIAAHEFGHSLGLYDNKPGPCESLMSGSSAGVECTNPVPNAEEVAAVEDMYAGGLVRQHAGTGKIVVEQVTGSPAPKRWSVPLDEATASPS